MGYKIVSKQVWIDEYQETNPNPLISPDGEEVLLSNQGDLTPEQAREHISINWDINQTG